MSADNALPANFCGPVRLFPLPNLVLFPHAVQPLHIFEPRYRDMTADALRGDRLIAMAVLQPGWEAEYHNSPPIDPVVCVGRVIKDEHLPDGRYNLLLHGLSRAHVLEELPTGKLYRAARVRLVEDVPVAAPEVERELRRQLSTCVNAWFASQTTVLAQLRKLLEGSLPLGALCDVFGFTMSVEVEVKRQLLAEADVERRARLLLDYLAPRLPTKLAPDPERRFPPEFSAN
jgi:Lon protease-like protein